VVDAFAKAHIFSQDDSLLSPKSFEYIMQLAEKYPANFKEKLLSQIPLFQQFITVAKLRACLEAFKQSISSRFFGKAGPELESLHCPCMGNSGGDRRVSFFEIYNKIRSSGGDSSQQRAEIFF